MIGDIRPELHRYCARLTGSVFDGEDVVQDAIAKAYEALETLETRPALRAWLFRIAHNRALDVLRSRNLRAAEPLETASGVADGTMPDPLEPWCARKRSQQQCRGSLNFDHPAQRCGLERRA
jgi:RNA polymerase sigma-70 factor (ECF subfamily)